MVDTVVTVVLGGVFVLVRVVVEVIVTASDKVSETVVVGTLLGFCVVRRVRQVVWEYVETLASPSRGRAAAIMTANREYAFMFRFRSRVVEDVKQHCMEGGSPAFLYYSCACRSCSDCERHTSTL